MVLLCDYAKLVSLTFLISILLLLNTQISESWLYIKQLSRYRKGIAIKPLQVVPLVNQLTSDSLTTTTKNSHYNQSFLEKNFSISVGSRRSNVAINTNNFDNSPITLESNNKIDDVSSGCYGVWMIRYYELFQYQVSNGHTLVPKRYSQNPALGNWVNKQRQQYRNYISMKKPCSLTKQRIDLLNEIGFCWNASFYSVYRPLCNNTTVAEQISKAGYLNLESNQPKTLGTFFEAKWRKNYEQLTMIVNTHEFGQRINTTRLFDIVPRQTPIGSWLQKQRTYYEMQKGPISSFEFILSADKINALNSLDPYWYMTRRDFQWEIRFIQLCEYKHKYGDCCVPIAYKDNKQLGQWVSNQRKKSNNLSKEKIERFNSIGFVWNRWEYEFEKKYVKFD